MSTDRVQHRIVHREGQSIWVASIGSYQTNTELGDYVINTRNIGEIKASQTELERHTDRLDEFPGIRSRDLRNPLNVASGRLVFAVEQCKNKDLAAAAQALARMQTRIAYMLNLARPGASVSVQN